MMTLARAVMISSLLCPVLAATLGAGAVRAERVPGTAAPSGAPPVQDSVEPESDSVALAAGVSDQALGFHMATEPALIAALAMLGVVLGWGSSRRRVLRRGAYGK